MVPRRDLGRFRVVRIAGCLPFDPSFAPKPSGRERQGSKSVSVELAVLKHVGVLVDPAVVAEPNHAGDQQHWQKERMIERGRRCFRPFGVRRSFDRIVFFSLGLGL